MDLLSQLLAPLTVTGSVFCHGEVRAPWHFLGGAPGKCLFHCVVSGEATLFRARRAPVTLRAGQIVLLPRGGHHAMGSAEDAPCVRLGDAVSEPTREEPFARFRIGGDGAATQLICGSFDIDGGEGHPLIRALPDVVVADAEVGMWLAETVASLGRLLDAGGPGASLISRRLTEILFVQALSSWVESSADDAGWLAALRDPSVSRALGAMHAEPARDWTSEELARIAGVSRSGLFARFREQLGETPGRYLTRWRIALAARALSQEGLTVAEASERVGYASVPSFTHAFRAQMGATPAAYRRRRYEG